MGNRLVHRAGGRAPLEIAVKGTLGGATSTATSTASTSPTIAGPAQAGRTLSVGTDGIVDPDGLTSPTYSYQWIRVDGSETDIGTATGSTYTPGADDLGKKLKVRVSFTDDAR